VNDGENAAEKRPRHDFVYIHEYPAGVGCTKRCRVRIFEEDGELPLVVLSSPPELIGCTVPDVERIAAEVMLRLYPRQAILARPKEPWFWLVEHLPKAYDFTNFGERRDELHEVTFASYRVTVGRHWPVLRPQKALRRNTKTRYGVKRLTFGSPEWGPRFSLEEVEARVGAKLGDAFGAEREQEEQAQERRPEGGD